MKFCIITFLFISLVTSVTGDDIFYPEKSALKTVKTVLKDKNISIGKTIPIDVSAVRETPVRTYLCTNTSGEEFYALFTQSKGRYDYFDYLLFLNLDYSVKKVSIIKYRSEHGGEIASKKWLTQFKGYSSGELRYKKEISAISGATISARSITEDIPKVISLLRQTQR